MAEVNFVSFKNADPEDFLSVLNEREVRVHLIDHNNFTSLSVREWIDQKLEVNALKGCRIRAIYIDKVLAGWCGVQPDASGYELAIVLSKRFWGIGISVFKTLMLWANELGHREVVLHLLDTRPEYKVLQKISSKVCKTELLGRSFTTYYIWVDKNVSL